MKLIAKQTEQARPQPFPGTENPENRLFPSQGVAGITQGKGVNGGVDVQVHVGRGGADGDQNGAAVGYAIRAPVRSGAPVVVSTRTGPCFGSGGRLRCVRRRLARRNHAGMPVQQ